MSEIVTSHGNEEAFEQQFKQSRTIESQGGVVRFVDIAPSAEKIEDTVPVTVASGFGLGPDAYKGPAETIYNSGRRGILLEHARRGKSKLMDDSRSLEHLRQTMDMVNILEAAGINPDKIKEELQKARSMVDVLRASGVEQTDVIAHSEGTIYTVLAALENPELFRSVVLIGPAGMIGEDNILQLGKRFSSAARSSLWGKDKKQNPEAAKATNRSVNKHVAKSLLNFKFLREANQIAKTPIDQLLFSLKKESRQKGREIHVGLIQWESDPVFTSDRIRQHVALEGVEKVLDNGDVESVVYNANVSANSAPGNIDAWASVADRDAGHGDLQIDPNSSTVAALDMLKTLNSQ